MDPSIILATLGGATLAGILVLGVMAARIDNARRFADLVRDTRHLRAVSAATPTPARRRLR